MGKTKKQKKALKAAKTKPAKREKVESKASHSLPLMLSSDMKALKPKPVGFQTRVPAPTGLMLKPGLLNAKLTGAAGVRTFMAGKALVTMTTESAPVAETAMKMERKFELTTLPNGNLRVVFHQPFADCVSAPFSAGHPDSFTKGEALKVTTANSSPVVQVAAGSLQLSPMAPNALVWNTVDGSFDMVTSVARSPFLPLQAMSYSRYKIKNQHFSYAAQGQSFQAAEPQLSESRLRFAFTADPCHPQLGDAAYLNGLIGYGNMEETPNSVQFAEWNSWQMRIPNEIDSWLYTYTPRTAVVSGAYDPVKRLTHCGAISCYDSGPTGTDSTRVEMPHGTIWWGGEVEFSDASPLLVNNITPLLLSCFYDAKDKLHATGVAVDMKSRSIESKETKDPKPDVPKVLVIVDPDDGDLVPSPPVYKPLPSNYPGGTSSSSKPKVLGTPPLKSA